MAALLAFARADRPLDVDNTVRHVWHAVQMAGSTEKGSSAELIPTPAIEKRIFIVRERQVMLDEDLADLYGVETRALIQQVKRNAKRFPADFMFQLDQAEVEALRSQIVISNEGRGGRQKTLRQLISPPVRPKRPVGFSPPEDAN